MQRKWLRVSKQGLENGGGCRVYGMLGAEGCWQLPCLSAWCKQVVPTEYRYLSSVCRIDMQVVPTEYRYLSKKVLPTNQFSVTEYFLPIRPTDRAWPAVYFLYDLSPIMFTIKEE
ncbi:unnamed protein product [Urochloa humidicola]